MSHYSEELQRIKEICFSNEEQLEIAIQTKQYLDTHFEADINLDSLARMRSTSKYHLIRMFKKYYGVTPRQFLIQTRLKHAKQLLKSGSSVSDACYSVGFGSIHTFSNLFKEKNGMAPSEYRGATFNKSES